MVLPEELKENQKLNWVSDYEIYTVKDFCKQLEEVEYITAAKDEGAGIKVSNGENGKTANIYNVVLTGVFTEAEHFPVELVESDLTGIYTNHVTDMSYMFAKCKEIKNST